MVCRQLYRIKVIESSFIVKFVDLSMTRFWWWWGGGDDWWSHFPDEDIDDFKIALRPHGNDLRMAQVVSICH